MHEVVSVGAVSGPKACVIGDPINHSRSPIIHNYWLGELGLAGSYGKVHVTPDQLPAFLDQVREGVWRGCNVTVPHKEAVAGQVDRLTPTADKLGAVNTVWLADGELWGDNTDVAGFLANLDDRAADWDRRHDTAVVLGAGGAARAVVYGLSTRGFERIIVVNRALERAQILVDLLQGAGGATLEAATWAALPGALEQAAFVVNTTSLGMTGQPALQIDLAGLPDDAVVHDIVYAPLETQLLHDARARDLVAIDGLGMLLHQAAPGFARWFGAAPKVSAHLRQLIIDGMTAGRK